ncbi:MAG: hypothetical protein RR293_04470 [Bacteroidales bacterium]
MKSFFEKDGERCGSSSRQVILERLLKRYPDRKFETDEELFDVLIEHESKLSDRYEKLRNDQSTLASLFISNPKMGGFVSEVIAGEDPLLACVRYFGKDVLECAGDENRISQLRKENDEYLARINGVSKIEKEINENWRHSEKAITRFKHSKGMSDEDFELFIEKVCHMCEHVFMSDFNYEVLETLYKGVNYDVDIDAVGQAAEVKGRNEKIILDKEKSEGDLLPGIKGGASRGEGDSDLTPIFGLRRRRSVWDM